MMGKQLSFLGQAHRIDTVRKKHLDRDIGAHGYDHQRKEKGVSPGQLGNQEDAGQRRMHDPGHDPRHSQQGEVLLRQIHRKGKIVGRMRKHESGNAS